MRFAPSTGTKIMRHASRDASTRSHLSPILTLASLLIANFLMASLWIADASEPVLEHQHAIAMHGGPKYPPGFSHFDYANPNAPKGGTLTLAARGSFDSINPLIVRGNSAAGMREYVLESLMARSYEEPFTLYGLLAETIATTQDRRIVEFRLRPEARFSTGDPVTADDVLFTWDLLRTKGRPNHRTFYSRIEKAERIDERTVRFTFDDSVDRELALILGLMPVLSKAATDAESFDQGSLKGLIGSGPYVLESAEAGASVTYRRNPDYWGRDLGLNQGRHNFDTIRYDYYRDDNAVFEAFKKGLYDVRGEGDPSQWATAYGFPAVNDGRVALDEFETGLPKGMSAFVPNGRRPPFDDVRVRKALIRAFDFEWINQTLYHGLYQRSSSFFEGSALSARGKPADEREKALLEPWEDYVDPGIMDGTAIVTPSDGSGRDRKMLREVLGLLKEAGFESRDGKLVNAQSGAPFEFEILVASRDQERLALAYSRTLERIGITVTVRLVDSAQYQRRRTSYDFDMIQFRWGSSLSPGNEQRFRWSSAGVETEGTFNFPGVDNPAVDAMIDALVAAEGRAEFEAAVRALDRVLLSGHYVVPLFHLPHQWVARWTRISRPETTPLFGYRIDTWWANPE
jgi:peptide/nickel transport system substrate-binding protein